MNNPSVVVEEFKPVVKNTLRGFVRVRMPSGMIFQSFASMETRDRFSASIIEALRTSHPEVVMS
jgi:hypothetical protein